MNPEVPQLFLACEAAPIKLRTPRINGKARTRLLGLEAAMDVFIALIHANASMLLHALQAAVVQKHAPTIQEVIAPVADLQVAMPCVLEPMHPITLAQVKRTGSSVRTSVINATDAGRTEVRHVLNGTHAVLSFIVPPTLGILHTAITWYFRSKPIDAATGFAIVPALNAGARIR